MLVFGDLCKKKNYLTNKGPDIPDSSPKRKIKLLPVSCVALSNIPYFLCYNLPCRSADICTQL